jgi:hypothetical protein
MFHLDHGDNPKLPAIINSKPILLLLNSIDGIHREETRNSSMTKIRKPLEGPVTGF